MKYKTLQCTHLSNLEWKKWSLTTKMVKIQQCALIVISFSAFLYNVPMAIDLNWLQFHLLLMWVITCPLRKVCYIIDGWRECGRCIASFNKLQKLLAGFCCAQECFLLFLKKKFGKLSVCPAQMDKAQKHLPGFCILLSYIIDAFLVYNILLHCCVLLTVISIMCPKGDSQDCQNGCFSVYVVFGELPQTSTYGGRLLT